MTSAKWQYLPAGYSRTLVFMPGWATDGRVLQRDKVHWDVIVPQQSTYFPEELISLADMLQGMSLESVTVVGWSMGGIPAYEFARLYPQCVDNLILASMRAQYPAEQIEEMKLGIVNEPEKTLRTFYRQIFFPLQMLEYRMFRQKLEASYLQNYSTIDLLKGLELLSIPWAGSADISCPISLLHGREDIISPLFEAITLAAEINADLAVSDQAGHALPWCDDFYKIINE